MHNDISDYEIIAIMHLTTELEFISLAETALPLDNIEKLTLNMKVMFLEKRLS